MFIKQGGGGLGTLTAGVKRILKEPPEAVEIVSVYGQPAFDTTFSLAFPVPHSAVSYDAYAHTFAHASPAPFACVWVSVMEANRGFMDPVKLQGFLALHIDYVSLILFSK